jgi:hypothetical protein
MKHFLVVAIVAALASVLLRLFLVHFQVTAHTLGLE